LSFPLIQRNQLFAHLVAESLELGELFGLEDWKVWLVVALGGIVFLPLFRFSEKLTLHHVIDVSVDAWWGEFKRFGELRDRSRLARHEAQNCLNPLNLLNSNAPFGTSNLNAVRHSGTGDVIALLIFATSFYLRTTSGSALVNGVTPFQSACPFSESSLS
ncbi:MAG TPA: hypothetical protein VLB68_21160, partial [Pyrinomonadaceae bacterium]|nr:hypothetical protein [Pyrinomonadaceae bacterium]